MKFICMVLTIFLFIAPSCNNTRTIHDEMIETAFNIGAYYGIRAYEVCDSGTTHKEIVKLAWEMWMADPNRKWNK